MTDAQKKAADRIRKLLVKTEESGCTAGEAAEAARIVRKILIEYDLDLSEVEQLQEAGESVDHELFNPAEHGLEDAGERVAWTEMLARIIARAHGCEILVFDGHSHVLFVGRELHRKTVTYLYGFLCRTARRLADEGYRQALAQYERDVERLGSSVNTLPNTMLGHLMALGLYPDSAPVRPDEHKYKSSFLMAFVVAVGQRFEDRAAASGALVLASTKAKDWVDQRTTEGDIREDKPGNQPELPRELDQRGTLQGFAHGASVSIDANAIEGRHASHDTRLQRRADQLGAWVPEPSQQTATYVDYDVNLTDTRPRVEDIPRPTLMRMRMSYFTPGSFFVQGQVVATWLNADGQTYKVAREDDHEYYALAVTREYLQPF